MFKLRYLVLVAAGAGTIAVGVLSVLRVRRAAAHLGPVTATVTINKTPREVYELLRDFSRLPEFMTYLASVEENGLDSIWTAKVPVIGEVTWKARIIEDVPGRLLAWEADPDQQLGVSGRVTFVNAPGREATEVRAELTVAGSRAIARVFAAPEVKGDLRRLKQVLETGEVLRSDASAHLKPHPAQPSKDAEPAPDFFIPHVPNVDKGAVS